MNAEWRAVLTEALEAPPRELGVAMPFEALVSLVMTFNLGVMVERLDWIDRWLSVAAVAHRVNHLRAALDQL